MDTSDLESALTAPWWRLRLPPALERAHQRSTSLDRARRLTVCGLVGMLSILYLTADDATNLPEAASLLTPMRALIAVFGFVVVGAGAALVIRARRPPARALECAHAVTLVLVVAYIIIAARHADDVAEHTLIGSLLLVFMYNGIVARLSLGLVTVVGIGSLVGYVLLGEPTDAVGRVIYQGHILLFGTGVSFTLLAVFLLGSRERRAFVLHELDARRRVALSDAAEELRQQALRDPLTGLANRRHCDVELHQLWERARRAGSPVAALALDVDHFKAYNDHYGHPAGDTCLQRLAAVFAQVAECHDGTAVRVGGEEFLLLLPGSDIAEAAFIADEVVRGVRSLGLPHARSSASPHVTISVGVAAVRARDGVAADQLLAAADGALYGAKAGGRDRWVMADGVPAVPAPMASPVPALSVASLDRSPGPVDPPGAEAIEHIQALLTRRTLRLRFPAALEADLWSSRRLPQGWGLTLLACGGFACCLFYLAFSGPLVPDLSGRLFGGILRVVAVLVAVLVVQQVLRPGWLTTYRATALAGAVYVLGLQVIVSGSESPTAYSLAIGVYLVPMFLGVVAQIPFRYTLVLSLLVVAGHVLLLRPTDVSSSAAHGVSVTILTNATVYSLAAAYLVERAGRREHLLIRLETLRQRSLVHASEELRRLATSDPLTGLTNRRGFETAYAGAWIGCRDAGLPLSLLIIDIDHFKQFNDGYGHPAGDECLRRVGAGLSGWAGARPHVTPFRLGGEEFGVLLPGVGRDGALDLAEQVRSVVRGLEVEHRWSPVYRAVTISVGVATELQDAPTDDRRLLANADAALYRAKASGRDRVAL